MIQVAFAGHNRPEDLGAHEPVAKALADTFALIKAAVGGPVRLLTGLAVGADELAARAWRNGGLGPIHAVLPHLVDADGTTALADELADSITRLDGAAFEGDGRNPHLKQTRVVIEAADLLVVVWTGGPARGAGGTADSVFYALQLGLPVLWVTPTTPSVVKLIRPDNLPLDFHFPEFQESLQAGDDLHLETPTVETIGQALHLGDDGEASHERAVKPWQHALDEWLHSWLWKTHATFRKLIGGKIHVAFHPSPVPQDLANQPGFKALSEAYSTADLIANRLSAVHRSEQILLVMAMIGAAVAGSAWFIWPQLKLPAVAVELGISVAAFLVWVAASDAKQHERWSEKRYLAEQLRLERAGWALGVSSSPLLSPTARSQHRAWSQARRAAGLPDTDLTPERVARWSAWALGELVHGQSAYHRATSERDGHIAHRIHKLEDFATLLLFISFSLYLAAAYTFGKKHLPELATGIIASIGTLVPAFAAASMALEAKLEFEEQSARSRRLAGILDEIGEKVGANPSFDTVQNAGRAAIRVLMAESSHWREGSGRRRMLRA